MRGRLVTAAVVGAVGLPILGCGEDAGTNGSAGGAIESGSEAPPLTKVEFLAQGNELCREAHQRIDPTYDQVFGGTTYPSPEALDQFMTETMVPNLREAVEGIQALNAPLTLQPRVDRLTSEFEQVFAELEEQGPPSSTEPDPFGEAYQLANEIGLDGCV
jgi:hypothetical protein